MSVIIWIETIKSNTGLFIVPNLILQCKHLHLDDLFVAQDLFNKAVNILRWWYLPLIIGVAYISY